MCLGSSFPEPPRRVSMDFINAKYWVCEGLEVPGCGFMWTSFQGFQKGGRVSSGFRGNLASRLAPGVGSLDLSEGR